MSDLPSTNQKLAELLVKQTYNERMEMAEWFADQISITGSSDKGYLAALLSDWANEHVSPEPTP